MPLLNYTTPTYTLWIHDLSCTLSPRHHCQIHTPPVAFCEAFVCEGPFNSTVTICHPHSRLDASLLAEVRLTVYIGRVHGAKVVVLDGFSLSVLLLEVCLRTDQSHGNGVILSHMQTLFDLSAELAISSTSNLVTHLIWSITLHCRQTQTSNTNNEE